MPRIPIVAALLLLLLPAAARAAEGDVVVGTLDGARLSVRDGSKGQFCVTLDDGTTNGNRSSGCDSAPAGRFGSEVSVISFGDRAFAGGAVPADGTTVELEFADETKLRTEATVSDAYTGRYKDTLRFLLVELPAGKTPPILLRRFDAAGKLVGASPIDEGEESATGERLLLLNRRGVRVSVAGSRAFSPTALRIDRLEHTACLVVSRRRNESMRCSPDQPYIAPLAVQASIQCGSIGTLVTGFAGPDVRKVVLVLGSGRRQTVATRELIGTIGTTRRAVAAMAPVHEAVREAIALDDAAKVLKRQAIGAAPGGAPCANGYTTYGTTGFETFGSTFAARPPEGQEAAAGAAPGAQLVARDEGDHLCLGIDRLAADRHDCVLPLPAEGGAYFPNVVRRATAQRTAAGGLLTGDAAAVRVQFDGRRTLEATVTDGDGYTGRYRGAVRFYLVETPGRHRVTNVQVLDAAGKTLSQFPGPDDPTTERQTVARGRGFRFFGLRYDITFVLPGVGRRHERGSCIGLVVGKGAPAPDSCALSTGDDEPGDVLGRISCSPRLGVLFGRMTKGLRGVTFDLAGGGRLIAGTVRIAKRYGGDRLWVVRIPPAAHIVRMHFLGTRPKPPFGPRGKSSGAYDLPAPRRQCGYAPRDPTF